jgi:rubrerythrin
MAVTASGKPTYLGLLNTLALAESRAHCYLTEWANVTPDPGVRHVLLTVAAREGEHGMTFAKRINELGFELRTKSDENADKALEMVRSECSDLEKMEALGLHQLDTGDEPDVFDGLFKDHTIDIRTGELLGRYIAEERDSARLFRACYEQLCEARNAAEERKSDTKADKAAKATAKQLSALDTKVDALCRAVDELRQIVCAQSMTPADPT